MFNFETKGLSTEAAPEDNGLMSEDVLQESEDGDTATSDNETVTDLTDEYGEEKEDEEDDGKVEHDNFNDVDEL